jgi:Zn finger protein HypA/HybF involved in hydrogenase expression
MTEVPTWVYRQCDCAEQNEDGDYDPDCPECDEGMIDIDCDTVVALKDIYGEDAPIVS